MPEIFRQALANLESKQDMRRCPIGGIGIWDTVGAVGLPNNNRDKAAFGEHYYHRVTIPQQVRHTYHAVSIDDERREFAPVLVKRRPGVEEVWFPGMHSDVGGGYNCLLYTSPSPRDQRGSRMPSSA